MTKDLFSVTRVAITFSLIFSSWGVGAAELSPSMGLDLLFTHGQSRLSRWPDCQPWSASTEGQTLAQDLSRVMLELGPTLQVQSRCEGEPAHQCVVSFIHREGELSVSRNYIFQVSSQKERSRTRGRIIGLQCFNLP